MEFTYRQKGRRAAQKPENGFCYFSAIGRSLQAVD
jgi:hypothetical protein